MNLRDGCFVRYRFAVVVLLALAGVLVPVTPVASADTALPINRVLYVQRVLPPQQTNYCGLAYTTRIVAADLPGGGNQQVLYTNSQGCYPLSYASVSPDRTRVAAVLGGSFFVFDVGSALAGNPETHGFQYGYCHLPKWNRDGSRILCEGPNETLRIVDAVTLNILGSLTLADRGIGPQDSDWLPDGDLLVTGVDKMSSCPVPGGTRTLNNVWRLDMNGLAMSGEPRPLLSTSCETGKDFIYNVRSAPDGSRFAYHAVQGQFGASIWVAEIDGGNDRQLAAATATRAFGRSSWSWSGRKIITDRLERDNTSPFGLYGHIDTIDVTTGTRRTDIPATGAYDALTPSSAEPADTTAPVVHGTADRPPDRNGWYNHPAVITWSPADEDNPSEALTVPPPTVAASQGKDVVYASGPSCDPAGNCATGTVTLSLDSTPPVTTVATTSAWVSTNVVLQFAVQDNLSGVDTTSHTVDGGPVATSSTAEVSAEGVHTVSFWSTDRAGNVESVRTVTVRIDKGAPAITYTLAPPANASGWHNSPVTATFSCSDSLSGVAFCSWPVSVIQDGANQSVTATAADNAGNQASITINNINIDTTKPTVQPIAFSVNPKRANETTTMTVTAEDSLSGIAGGEYFVGSDAGIGAATPITLSGNSLTATISGLTAGLYSVGVRARDAAGNWSNTTTDTLVVYDPSGGFVTAAGRIVPSGSTSDAGDALPGLDHTSAATVHFEMKYRTTDSTPTGDLAFKYQAGRFDLDMVGLEWLMINGSLAIAQGTATIGGQNGVFPFRLTATGTSSPGHILLRVYPAGVNPSSSTPIYQASGDLVGRLMIHS